MKSGAEATTVSDRLQARPLSSTWWWMGMADGFVQTNTPLSVCLAAPCLGRTPAPAGRDRNLRRKY